MQVFLFIDGYDEYGIAWVEQFFGQVKPFFNHRQAIAVPVGVGGINVIIVVFPVCYASVVGGSMEMQSTLSAQRCSSCRA